MYIVLKKSTSHKVSMGIMTQLTFMPIITWSKSQNRTFLVSFDSSHQDESNGTKIVRFWSLDHAILQIKIKAKKSTNYCTCTDYDAPVIFCDLAIRIEWFWYYSIRLNETSWMVPKSFYSNHHITSYKQ